MHHPSAEYLSNTPRGQLNARFARSGLLYCEALSRSDLPAFEFVEFQQNFHSENYVWVFWAPDVNQLHGDLAIVEGCVYPKHVGAHLALKPSRLPIVCGFNFVSPSFETASIGADCAHSRTELVRKDAALLQHLPGQS